MSFWRKIKLVSLIILSIANTIKTYAWWAIWINEPATFSFNTIIFIDIGLSITINISNILIAWADKAEVEEKGN